MKLFTLILIAVLFSPASFSQTHRVTIYSWVDRAGHTYYGDLSKWLPDSLQKKLLVEMKVKFRYKDGQTIMFMTNLGWTLLGPDPQAKEFVGTLGSMPIYMFSREIIVDDKTFALLNNNLDALKKE